MSTNDHLKRAIEARANAWEHAKAILDEADARGDATLSAEDEARWDKANADIAQLDKRIRDLQSLATREAEARATLDELGDFKPADSPKRDDDTPSDADVLRQIARGERRQAEFRDLTVGTATAGGNTVPTGFFGQLQEHMIEVSGIRQSRATVLRTGMGNDLQVPKTTADSSASIIGEGTAITESDPTFGQVTLQAYKYALIIQVSRELSEDSGVDLEGYLARQAGRAIGNASGAHFVTGTGTSQPRGVITAAATGVNGGTGQSGVPTADEVIDLYYSVIAPYRVNAEWLMGDGAEAEIRKLKGSDNNYLWQPGLQAGTPNLLLGKPIVNDPNVDDPALNAKSLAFGDLSAYMIRDVNSVAVDRSTDFAFGSDLVSWRFIFRTDGDLVDETGAVKVYVGAAT